MAKPIYDTTTTKIKPIASDASTACQDIRQMVNYVETNISILDGLLANKNKQIAKDRLDLLDVRIEETITTILLRK